MFGVIVTIILILVVLYIILEGIRSTTNRAFQHKMEDELNKKSEEWKAHLNAEQQKKNVFDNEINQLSKKWKDHALYHDVLSVCKSEVVQFCTEIEQEKIHQKYFSYVEEGSLWYKKEISPGPAGIGGDMQVSFKSLGYQNLTVQQYLALTLAICDGLNEVFDTTPDIRISASYYESFEDGWVNKIQISVRAKSQDILKTVDLE